MPSRTHPKRPVIDSAGPLECAPPASAAPFAVFLIGGKRIMRRVLPRLLAGTACLVFLAACGSDNNNGPSEIDPQQQFLKQLNIERGDLSLGKMSVTMPTSGVQGGTATLSVEISGTPSTTWARPTTTVTISRSPSGGKSSASPTATVVSTFVFVGGLMTVNADCMNVTCSPASSNVTQPVGPDFSPAGWSWELTYNRVGTSTIKLHAVLYQGDSQYVLWAQSVPLTLSITTRATQAAQPTPATTRQKVDKSLGWLHDTVVSVSAVFVALTPIATVFFTWRARRRRRRQGISAHGRPRLSSRGPSRSSPRGGTPGGPRWLRNQRRG